ncbi:MAG: amino acid ABC transporter permease [Ruminococcaceae bacterium]|nr:amino acid ABC transporter permease [Oscillospiraceae bacterium]
MYEAKKESIFAEVWQYWQEREAAGRKTGATNILALLNKSITPVLEEQPKLTGETTVVFYDTGAEKPQLYLSDETLDTLLGGYITVRDDITSTTKITVDGETFDIEKNNTIRTGIANYFGLNNYDAERPDTSTPLTKVWNSFVNDLHKNFIEGDRWKYLATGLGNTLAITGLALILGIVLGFLSAVVRVVHEQTGKMVFLDRLVKLYVSVIRGTPIMVQLLIIYFVLLLPAGVDKFPAAVLCFGLNSGAYVSEIIRGGIMSIDQGQTEAGRSLGFGFGSTMIHIILPQAFKAVLPSLCNEFITLLKETSVAFYIGVADLTQGGLKIRSITYSNFMPLIAVALIYLVLVLILTKLVGILERRLRKSER